jgi:FkbM family methyltransferase
LAANSALRRALKRVLFPLLPERVYALVQAAVMARDIRSGTLHEPELALLALAVQQGETALDIGANFGLYSYHLSRAVGPSGKVYAFEPIPFTCSVFRTVSRLLGFRNVELIPRGCAERTGTVAFRVPIQDSGAATAGLSHMVSRQDERAGIPAAPGTHGAREVFCDVVALDEYLPDLTGLSFIKCDIEGAEIFALRGARRLIERHRPTVLCEIDPRFLRGFGVRVEELTGFFAALGYGFYRFEEGPTLHPAVLSDIRGPHNFLFIHGDRSARFASAIRRAATVAAE